VSSIRGGEKRGKRRKGDCLAFELDPLNLPGGKKREKKKRKWCS